MKIMAPIKTIYNQPREDIDKIDAQEKNERKLTWEGVWLIYLILERRNEIIINLKFRKINLSQSGKTLNFEMMLSTKLNRAK